MEICLFIKNKYAEELLFILQGLNCKRNVVKIKIAFAVSSQPMQKIKNKRAFLFTKFLLRWVEGGQCVIFVQKLNIPNEQKI